MHEPPCPSSRHPCKLSSHPTFHNIQQRKQQHHAANTGSHLTQVTYTIRHIRDNLVANMPGKIIPVTSASHFETLLNSSTYTIVDFYADWCGPCKAIAPVFQTLAEKETKPGKLQFVKVDVDAQQEVARKYGVSAYVHLFTQRRRLQGHRSYQ